MRLRLSAATSAVSLFFPFFLAACNSDPKPRRYTEIAFHVKGSSMAPSEAPIRISWTAPSGWVEQPGGDPLRIASFLAPDSASSLNGEMDPKAVDISIVQFAGNAGGLSANISRWMGQLKIPPTPDLIQSVVTQAKPLAIATGQKGIVADFTDLLAGDMTRTTSIVGAIIEGGDYTVFVKAMGDRDRLVQLKPQLLAFCQSVSIVEEKK